MADDSPRPDGSGPDAIVEKVFWEPHASPRSVWPFVAMYPFVVLAVYRRSWRLLAAVLLAVGVNLRTVSPPETDEAWATRVVLGERVWVEEGLQSSPGSLGVLGVGGMVNLFALRAAAKRQPLRTAVGTVASLAFTLLFFDRMVRVYERRRDREDQVD